MKGKSTKISQAKIDALVFMKILKHAKEIPFQVAIGQIHGIYHEEKGVVEVSNCYPLTNVEKEEGDFDYEMRSIETLNEVGLDNNKVGWYQISYRNNHLIGNAFDAQNDYQSQNPNSIYLVYDILEVERGGKNPLRAFRIKPTYFDLYRNDKLNLLKIKGLNFRNEKIFEEIPVEITVSPLAKAFLAEHRKFLKKSNYLKNSPKYDYTSYLERNTKEVTDYLAELDEIQMRMNADILRPDTKGQKLVIERKPIEYETPDYMEFVMVLSRTDNFNTRSRAIGNFLLDSNLIIEDLIKKN